MPLYSEPHQEPYQETQRFLAPIRYLSEYHVACVLLLDTSDSMNVNNAIGKLNEGIKLFKEQIVNNPSANDHTKACIDVAIVTFGSDVRVVQEFMPVCDMTVPILSASGKTPMGAALNKAMDLIQEQKEKYRRGTPYYRPWIFSITDGYPTDSYENAAQRLKAMEQEKAVLGYCVGVEGFSYETMAKIFDEKRIYQLDNLNFSDLFLFLSNSLTQIRESDPNAGRTMNIEVTKDMHRVEVEY